MSDDVEGELFPELGGVAPQKKVKGKNVGAGEKKNQAPVRKTKVHQEFSAGFILIRETAGGMVYLLLDYGKHWDYPKGHLEEGETAWQAAVRELREETGIRQVDRVGNFERTMQYVFFSPRKGRIHKTVTYFLGRTRAEEIVVSEEHTGFAWLAYEEALARLTYENARELLTAAHAAVEQSSQS